VKISVSLCSDSRSAGAHSVKERPRTAIHNHRRAGLTLNPCRQRDESGRGREIRAVLQKIMRHNFNKGVFLGFVLLRLCAVEAPGQTGIRAGANVGEWFTFFMSLLSADRIAVRFSWMGLTAHPETRRDWPGKAANYFKEKWLGNSVDEHVPGRGRRRCVRGRPKR